MKRPVQFLLLLATATISATAYGSDIIQVAGEGCTQGCNSANGCNTGGCNSGYCNSGNCNYGNCNYGNCNACQNGYYCDASCQAGQCTMRTRVDAMNLNWCHPCGPIGAAARCGVPGAAQVCRCCNTKAFPDSGWAPPARIPVRYTGRGFQTWYGNEGPFPGGAPMVYQPNDTSQLGFSYANVPTWGRNPWKIPRVPQPGAFHTRACPGACGNNGCLGVCGPVYGSACPTCNPGMVMMAPHAAPVVRMIPPQPTQPLAVNRRAPAPSQAIQRVSRTTFSQPSAPTRQSRHQASAGRTRSASGARGSSRTATQQKKSKGWFGLPSLSDVKFGF